MYIPINCYLKGITSSYSRKTKQGKLSQEIKTLKLFYTDVNLTEWKLMNSPNTISSTFVSWKPNTFSARHVIIPWSSKRTSLIANWSAVIVWRLWSPPFLPCTDHLMFGVGLPDAEALSDKFPPSCIEICDGGLLVNRGGATDEIWKHINNIQKKHTCIKKCINKECKLYHYTLHTITKTNKQIDELTPKWRFKSVKVFKMWKYFSTDNLTW